MYSFLQRSLIGLARDLRGVAYAFNTKTSYMMLYDWLYPNYFQILLRGIELWYHEPALTTPILKLMCELAQNRYLWNFVHTLEFKVPLNQSYRIFSAFDCLLTKKPLQYGIFMMDYNHYYYNTAFVFVLHVFVAIVKLIHR